MAIGRTFPESLQKAMRSLEHGRLGLACDPAEAVLDDLDDEELLTRAAIGTPDRPFQLEAALRRGISVDVLAERTKVDPWFLDQILAIVEERASLLERRLRGMDRARRGGGPSASASPTRSSAGSGRCPRPTCAPRASRPACAPPSRPSTPARPSSRPPRRTTTPPTRTRTRSAPSDQEKVLILGSGPNRIGQGIEFDYCCVHASFALADAGLRDGDAQLQPRDGVHRLRHLRPPLLRAADPRGRPQRHRGGAGRRHPEGRHRRASAGRRR